MINAAASNECHQKTEVLSADQGLAIFLQAKLTKYQYEVIRKVTKTVGCCIFPSYKKIILAKKQCYPNDLSVTETSAGVPLQSLMDHTVRRILEMKPVGELGRFNNQELTLTTKWGFDGASGQNEFSQKYLKGEGNNLSDSNLFMTSVV